MLCMLSWQMLSLGCLVLHLMTSILMGFEAFGSLGKRWTVVKGRRSGVKGGVRVFGALLLLPLFRLVGTCFMQGRAPLVRVDWGSCASWSRGDGRDFLNAVCQ